MPCCYSQVSLLVPLGGGHPLSLPLQPHFHFVESLVYNIRAQGHFFYVKSQNVKAKNNLKFL